MHFNKVRPSSISLRVNRTVQKSMMEKLYGQMHYIPNEIKLPEAIPPFRKMITTKAKRKSQPCLDNLKEFTSTTTLHGFRYLLDKRYSRIERLWWLLIVICGIAMSIFFITRIWNKWNNTQVILRLSDVYTSAWDIPFPAVTICSETKSRQRIFNYTKAFNERWAKPSSISEKDLKLYHDMLLVCNNFDNDGPDFADKSSIETIGRLAPTLKETFTSCSCRNFSCDQMFYHTYTKDGYCFTFNMFSAEEMFRTENLHKDYYHVGGQNRSAWTMDKTYAPGSPIDTYPLRGLTDNDNGVRILLSTDLRDLDGICRGSIQGFKVWLHNPGELPYMGQNFIRLSIQHHISVAITPELKVTRNGLYGYSPRKRRCYLEDERYLSFFRIYTQRNCVLECTANYTATRCGCVPLYMPHGPNTKICGGGKADCISKAKEEMSFMKANLDGKSYKSPLTCGCLLTCTELQYNAVISHGIYDLAAYQSNPDPDIAHGRILPSGLLLYFAENKFTSIIRTELYDTMQFLANCGGVFAFFMGFSILSFVEIVFYFTMRLWCRMRRSTVAVIRKKKTTRNFFYPYDFNN